MVCCDYDENDDFIIFSYLIQKPKQSIALLFRFCSIVKSLFADKKDENDEKICFAFYLILKIGK